MASSRSSDPIKLWTPATYRIEVEGMIDEAFANRLAGMLITRRFRNDRSPISTLIGKLSDQAELNGVLTSLYELHLPILSVEYVSGESSNGE